MNKLITIILSFCLLVSQSIGASSLDLTNKYPKTISVPSIASINCNGYLDLQCTQEALAHWRQSMDKLNEDCRNFQNMNIDFYNQSMDDLEKSYQDCLNVNSEETCNQEVYNNAVAIETIYNKLKDSVDDYFESSSKEITKNFISAIELCCLEDS